MNIISKLNNLNSYEKLYLFVLITLFFDMGGGFGLKLIGILVLIIASIFKINNGINIRIFKFEIILFLFLPCIQMLLSVFIWDIPINDSISQITCNIVWLLALFLVQIDYKNLIKIFNKIAFIASIVTIFTFFLILFLQINNNYDSIFEITSFARRYRVGYIGVKSIGQSTLIPDVFFRYIFLLIPSSFMLYAQKSQNRLIIVVLALILTTSTANILFTLLGLFILSITLNFKNTRNYSGLKINHFITMGIISLLLIEVVEYINISDVVDFVLSKLTLNSESTNIKVNAIKSITDVILSNPLIFLFGSGVGSKYLDTRNYEWTINSEVSHFNLLRQFGVVYTILFFVYIGYLIYKLVFKTNKEGCSLGIGLLMVFFAAGTNPLLLSPLFFLILVLAKAYYISFTNYNKLLKS